MHAYRTLVTFLYIGFMIAEPIYGDPQKNLSEGVLCFSQLGASKGWRKDPSERNVKERTCARSLDLST